MDVNKKFWNEQSEYLSYPNEAVVRFLAANRPKDDEKKVLLDWGCANGRHLAVAKKFGFELIGVDYSKPLLEVAKKSVLEAKFILNDGLSIKEISDNFVDTLLCFGVIFWNNKENQAIMLNEIARILKPGGVAFIDFRSERDTGYKIASHLKDKVLLSQSLDEIKELVKNSGLKLKSTEIYEFSANNMEYLNSWYQCTIQKS